MIPERLRPSFAKRLIAECPAKAFLGGDKGQTDTMRAGDLVDSLVFSSKQIIVIEADDWRKKEPKEQRDNALARGMVPCLSKELAAARPLTLAVLAKANKLGLPLGHGLYQQTMKWTDPDTGVECQGTPDVIDCERRIIWDLKVTNSCHPKALQKTIETFGYHIQLAAYESGAETLYGGVGHWQKYLLFVEDSAPHVTVCVSPSEPMMMLGSRQWLRALKTFKECRETNLFPGYADDVLELGPTVWALNEEADREGV